MKKKYIIPKAYVVEVKGPQLLYTVSVDGTTDTDGQYVKRFFDDYEEEEDNGSLLLGDPNN